MRSDNLIVIITSQNLSQDYVTFNDLWRQTSHYKKMRLKIRLDLKQNIYRKKVIFLNKKATFEQNRFINECAGKNLENKP